MTQRIANTNQRVDQVDYARKAELIFAKYKCTGSGCSYVGNKVTRVNGGDSADGFIHTCPHCGAAVVRVGKERGGI